MQGRAASDSHERRFWAVFESAGTPMLVADDSRRYVAVNRAACELIGATAEQLCDMRIDDLTPRAQRAEVPQRWHDFLRAGSLTADYRLSLPDGRELDVEFSATANVLPGRHLSIFVTTREEVVAAEGTRGRLTPREREVLALIGMGHTSAEVGASLNIAPTTVATHTRNILGKLGARSRAHAIALAVAEGELALAGAA